MKANEQKCTLCIEDRLTTSCLVSDEGLSYLCPCKECIVRIVCTNISQSCSKFDTLYDLAVRMMKKKDLDTFKQAGVAERPKAADL